MKIILKQDVENVGRKGDIVSVTPGFGRNYLLPKKLAKRNVTCNAIAPGFIETDMTDVLSDKVKERILMDIPKGTLGQTEDIAHLAYFLAGEKSHYITGQVIAVDGGMSM